MGTDIAVKIFGGVEAAKKYAAAAYAAAATIAVGNDGKPILRLTEDGDWIFGQDETALHKTDLLAINPASFKHGYIAFDDKGIAEDDEGNPAEILLPIVQPLPYRDELPRLAEPRQSKRSKRTPKWQDQLALDLIVVDGKNKGAEMVYKPTSVGGLRMCAKLFGEIARRVDAGESEIVPLVELDASSYYNRTWNKDVAVPEHHIVEWKDFDDGDFVAVAPAKERAKSNGKGAEKLDAREKTRRGDPVDARRSARRDDDEDEAPRGRRAARRDDEVDDQDEEGEPRRALREATGQKRDAKPATRRREEPAEDEAPRGRRGRSVEDEVEEDEAPRRTRRGRDEEPAEGRSRRSRDDEGDKAESAPRARRGRDEDEVDDEDRPAPRRARRDEPEEDDGKAGVRGRKAAAGGRVGTNADRPHGTRDRSGRRS